jgi:hypothetical protein
MDRGAGSSAVAGVELAKTAKNKNNARNFKILRDTTTGFINIDPIIAKYVSWMLYQTYA